MLQVNGEAIHKSTPWRAQYDSAEQHTWYTSSKVTYIGKDVATIEATASVKVSALAYSMQLSRLLKVVLPYAIDMLKFSQCLGKKYTLATPLIGLLYVRGQLY